MVGEQIAIGGLTWGTLVMIGAALAALVLCFVAVRKLSPDPVRKYIVMTCLAMVVFSLGIATYFAV